MVGTFSIPRPLILNCDQTGVLFMPGSASTYHAKGSKEVRVVGKEEKRAFTLVVGSAVDGTLLPFQVIMKGSTARSLPTPAARAAAAAEYGANIEWALNAKNHWSDLASMQQYVNNVLAPFRERVIEEHNLGPDTKALLVLDLWSVHRSEAFRTWLASAHPWAKLVFIPGGCTGVAQPADVVLQRPIKAAIARDFNKWAADQVAADMHNGGNGMLDTSTPALRERLPASLARVWVATAASSELISTGFDKCGITVSLDADVQRKVQELHVDGKLFNGKTPTDFVLAKASRQGGQKRKARAAARAAPASRAGASTSVAAAAAASGGEESAEEPAEASSDEPSASSGSDCCESSSEDEMDALVQPIMSQRITTRAGRTTAAPRRLGD
ncbi:hypothetical protein ABPG75_011650 [Micractinium tetrahymenae]